MAVGEDYHLRMPILTVFAVLAALLFSGVASSADASRGSAKPVVFDAEQLRQGIFTYQLTSKGKPAGVAKIEIRALSSGDYLIRSDADVFRQSWSSTFKWNFVPVSAELHMPGRDPPYRMSLKYSGARVSGEESRGSDRTAVDAALAGQVVDQRVDWAAMMAAVIKGSIRFDVFDPGTGISRLEGSRKASDPIDGVTGRPDAIALRYTIHKTDHDENYIVYATEALPRMMLREEMPNELVADLIRIEN